MKYDELTGFKCAVAVAVACLEDERPKGESIQPEAAAQYVSDVLEVLLSSQARWLRNWKAPCSAWPKWKNGSLLDGGA